MCVRCKRKSNNAFLSKSSFPGRPPHAIHRIVLANTLFGHAPVQKPETSFKRSHLLCSERASLSGRKAVVILAMKFIGSQFLALLKLKLIC